MVKKCFKWFIFILLLGFCLYAEEYIHRGVGMFVGMGVTLIGFLINDWLQNEGIGEYLMFSGCALFFIFFFFIANGVHIENNQDGVAIYSAFYTHELDRGECVETKDLNWCYNTKKEAKKDRFIFLYKGDSCTVFTRHEKVKTIPANYSISEGFGNLHFISFDGKNIDLRGTEVTRGYEPYVFDDTPMLDYYP